jgi:hypothetical protein
VLGLIAHRLLRALNVSTSPARRPRYRIDEADLAKFEQAAGTDQPKASTAATAAADPSTPAEPPKPRKPGKGPRRPAPPTPDETTDELQERAEALVSRRRLRRGPRRAA